MEFHGTALNKTRHRELFIMDIDGNELAGKITHTLCSENQAALVGRLQKNPVPQH